MYFSLFIIFSLLISVCYYLGRKKNLGIVKSVGKSLEETLKPLDQNYTWLGGTIGFRANFKIRDFKNVQATLTLLPRQSPLYYPASFLVSGFDRLYVTFFLISGLNSEGHIINRGYFKFRGPKIENLSSLSEKKLESNNKKFLLFYENHEIEVILLNIFKELDKEGYLGIVKHIALVPERNTIFFLIVPKEKMWKKFLDTMMIFASKLTTQQQGRNQNKFKHKGHERHEEFYY